MVTGEKESIIGAGSNPRGTTIDFIASVFTKSAKKAFAKVVCTCFSGRGGTGQATYQKLCTNEAEQSQA